MSVEVRPFFPLYNQTQYAQTGTTSALTQQGSCVVGVTVVAANAVAVASTAFPGTNNNADAQIQISNKTSVWVHVNFGSIQSPQTVRAATINDLPVAPGTVVTVSVDPEVNAASVFADGAPAASTSVIFTRGSGT
jgi:hypothetical protein